MQGVLVSANVSVLCHSSATSLGLKCLICSAAFALYKSCHVTFPAPPSELRRPITLQCYHFLLPHYPAPPGKAI